MWHKSQQLEELPDGGVRLAMKVCRDWALHGWILSWGPHVHVAAPSALAEEILVMLDEARESYVPKLDFDRAFNAAGSSAARSLPLLEIRLLVKNELLLLPSHRRHHLADFQRVAVQFVDDPQHAPLVLRHGTQVVEHSLDHPLRLFEVAGRVGCQGRAAGPSGDDGRHHVDDVAVHWLGTVLGGINGFPLDGHGMRRQHTVAILDRALHTEARALTLRTFERHSDDEGKFLIGHEIADADARDVTVPGGRQFSQADRLDSGIAGNLEPHIASDDLERFAELAGKKSGICFGPSMK